MTPRETADCVQIEASGSTSGRRCIRSFGSSDRQKRLQKDGQRVAVHPLFARNHNLNTIFNWHQCPRCPRSADCRLWGLNPPPTSLSVTLYHCTTWAPVLGRITFCQYLLNDGKSCVLSCPQTFGPGLSPSQFHPHEEVFPEVRGEANTNGRRARRRLCDEKRREEGSYTQCGS